MKKQPTSAFYLILVFIFCLILSPLGKAQTLRNNVVNQQDLVFFQGDSLNGFPLENEYAKCKQLEKKPGALYEYKYILKHREAAFVKQKYHIDKLHYEGVIEKMHQQNAKPVITEQVQQTYRQNHPPQTNASSCNNIDFEDANFTNWVGYEGYNEGTNNPLTPAVGPLGPPPTNLNNAETSCQYFAVISNGSTDPNMGITLTSPLGGNCARMGGENRNLGDANTTTCTGNGGGTFNYTIPTACEATYFGYPIGTQVQLGGSAGEVLETTFTVTPQNSAFQYAYLFAYTDNGDHDTTQQPYFKVRVLDHNGQEINCLNYFQQGLGNACGSTHAPPGYSGSLATGLFYTSNWQVSSLNLLPYLNQAVTVIFTVAGCTVGGHFGYAYVDCACAPQQIIIPNTACIGANTTLIAPPLGGAIYQWTTPNGNIVSGGTTSTVTVNQSGTYSVTITPTKSTINGSGNLVTQTLTTCAYELDTTITLYPNPTIAINSTSICSGGTATLTAASSGIAGALNYTWNPAAGFTYTNAGDSVGMIASPATTSYTVTGTSVHGCTNTAVGTVTVTPNPPATFNIPPNCNGTSATFTNTTVGGSTYFWNFGDLTTLADTSHIQNPTYNYPSSGNYAVNFTVTTAAGCKSNSTQTVTVSANPGIHFTANHPCDGSAVTFTNTTANQASFSHWHWDFDDGDTSNAVSPSYTYTAPAGFSAAGCYSVTLTATTTAGCTGSHDTIVYVHNNPFAYFNAFEACLGDASEFIDSSFVQNPSCLNDQITSWNYDFGDGQVLTYNSITLPDTIKHIYASCGGYNITATVTTNNGCTFSNTLPGDTVFCLPVVVAPTDFSVCPGAATPIQTFTTTCANGGTPTAQWFQSLTNVDNTGAPASFINPGGNDQVPSYNAIAQNLSCNLLKDSVYGVAISGVGCIGNATYYVANVYPTPILSHMDTVKVCANQSVTVTAFVACPTPFTTAWTNNTTSIGLAASGNGNITSFTGLNTTTQVVDALITVTPSANGCIGPDSTFNIVVSPLPSMTVSSYTTCPATTVPSPTITTSAAGTTYNWTATNHVNIGMPASGSGTPSTYTAPANNSLVNQTGLVTYTPSLNGCIGTSATETITIKPTPFVDAVPNRFYCPSDFVPPIVFYCNPTGGVPIFSYTGLGGIGITQTGNIGSFSATNNTSSPVINSINVTATLNGCTGPATNFSITVYPNPTANFAYKPVCEGKPVSFIDQSSVGGGISINSWQWDMNNDGVIDITTQNPQYTVTPAGVDSVSLQVATNTAPSCSSFVKKAVIINPNPVVDFIGVDLKGCPRLNTAYTDMSTIASGHIVNWDWSFGNGQTSTAQFPQPQVYTNSSSSTPAYYSASLVVTSDSGCVGSKVKNNYIEVYPKPIAGFSWSPNTADLLDPSITFVNNAIGASVYTPAIATYGPYGVLYNLGDNYLTGNASNIVNNNDTYFNHSYNNPDYADVVENYTVTQWVINTYGCKDSTQEVVVIQPIVTFYIPNAFTPNGDVTNEGFKGTGIGIDNTTYNLWIFDRWGLMIYHAQDLEKAWDGHMSGHEGQAILQEDVYVWKVKFTDILHKSHEYHGTVTLIK